MTGIALALKTQGYEVFVRRSDGSRVRPTDRDRRFVQRGGAPAGIAAAADGPANASSIVFRRGDRPAWELLNGVLFRGPQRRLPRNRCRPCARYRRHHAPQLRRRQSAWAASRFGRMQGCRHERKRRRNARVCRPAVRSHGPARPPSLSHSRRFAERHPSRRAAGDGNTGPLPLTGKRTVGLSMSWPEEQVSQKEPRPYPGITPSRPTAASPCKAPRPLD